jgi:hypothetical protein
MQHKERFKGSYTSEMFCFFNSKYIFSLTGAASDAKEKGRFLLDDKREKE